MVVHVEHLADDLRRIRRRRDGHSLMGVARRGKAVTLVTDEGLLMRHLRPVV